MDDILLVFGVALGLAALCLGAALWVAGEADRRGDGRRP
jgi:hypothetical protein